MIVTDKTELRRCVKQAVRRAQVAETLLRFDVQGGVLGVDALMAALPPRPGTPFGPDGAAVYAALSALELPARDLDSARAMQGSYDRGAWLREVLDAMRAQRVLAVVPVERAGSAALEDDRISPMIVADAALLAPGRYGIPFEAAARQLAGAVRACGARDVLSEGLDMEALRYAVLPVCEEERCVLHVALDGEAQVCALDALLGDFPGVRAVAWAQGRAEALLIEKAAHHTGLLVRLTDMARLPLALDRLGCRFLPYASGAALPELMLGRWLVAREQLWPLLAEAYLPLARAGYPLDSQKIESDVNDLLTGSLKALYL